MKQKFANQCRISSPIKQVFEIERRYDKEWRTHFISLACYSVDPKVKNDRPFAEEITICINSKKEAEAFLKNIKQVLKGIKK